MRREAMTCPVCGKSVTEVPSRRGDEDHTPGMAIFSTADEDGNDWFGYVFDIVEFTCEDEHTFWAQKEDAP